MNWAGKSGFLRSGGGSTQEVIIYRDHHEFTILLNEYVPKKPGKKWCLLTISKTEWNKIIYSVVLYWNKVRGEEHKHAVETLGCKQVRKPSTWYCTSYAKEWCQDHTKSSGTYDISGARRWHVLHARALYTVISLCVTWFLQGFLRLRLSNSLAVQKYGFSLAK